MIILKPINNNVVSAYDQNGQEIVVMGRGVGYKAKEGSEITEDKIEKIFRMDDQIATDKLKELLATLPLAHIQVSNDIIAYAKKILGKRLNQNIYITLTDHINFAVLRYRQGMRFQNALLLEVRRFYHQEYTIGKYALDLIKTELGIHLPLDEAASIALHIVNAEYDTSLGDTMKIAGLIQEVFGIVKETFSVDLEEPNFYVERFLTHLKFLALRIFRKEIVLQSDDKLQEMLAQLYPQEYQCAQSIAVHIETQYGYQITGEETAYLTMHIHRIRTL